MCERQAYPFYRRATGLAEGRRGKSADLFMAVGKEPELACG